MRRTVVVATLVALALSGCGASRSSLAAPSPTPTASDVPAVSSSTPATTSCPTSTDPGTDQGADPRNPLLPAEVVPAAVVRCRVEQRDLPGKGRWTVVVQERADSGLGDFVSAMRAADEPTPDNQLCRARLVLVPWFVVVEASGHVVRARMPLDSCGQPKTAVLAAFEALPYRQVSATPLRQELTVAQAAAEARADTLGCTFNFKDMIALGATNGFTDATKPLLSSRPDTVAVCRYGVSSQDSQVLEFVSGVAATPAETGRLLTALDASTPVRACAVEHRDVVGLFSSGAWVLVELDGCHRAAGDGGGLRQVPPAALALLATTIAAAH